MRPSKKLGNHVGDPISRNCLDRLSSLPDDILGHMLSFLPTRFAVSTSILSTRWRYLFTLTTCLSFDDAPCSGKPGTNGRVKATRRFKKFVNKVLKLHKISPIQKFSLVCQNTYDASVLNRWFSFALQKGVQELHYQLCIQTDCPPDSDGFFMSETLVSLKKIGRWYYAIKIPISAWLPKLKILHVDRVVLLDFDSLERLFSSCALLEELTLKTCECDEHGHVIHRTGMLRVLTIECCCFLLGTFEIDAPNLAYLTYSSNIGVNIIPSWKHSRSFVRAELTFRSSRYDDFDTNRNSVKYDRELLKAAASKATKLCFKMDSVQFIIDDDDQMPDFPSLSRLHIDNFPYEAWKYVTSLVDKAPQLETVIFESGFHCCYCSDLYYYDENCGYCDSLSPSDIPLYPFSCQAQLIEVHNCCGHKVPLLLREHFHRNASVLKRLIIYTKKDLDLEVEQKISEDLLMLPGASRNCKLEMKLKPSYY
ncbi:putative F-box/LRR-repeat protein At3g58880 [Silene latifolia]|uniref:putative F-box/LRR-repeat protein At3g58880 n=1 Tax=Silene latifolia TaxID=37657 RepID=UPI003D786F4A